MDFKHVPAKYRPIPFWSWNEKLTTEETAEQIHKMHDVGIGGFFMHARGGLMTEYMGKEWFDNVKAAVDAAEECGMRAWAYDENGWPSGFGSGVVNGLGVKYQQKYLRYEKSFEHKDTAIAQIGDIYFYYEINPFYVDTLDKNVIKEFIKCSYEPYYEKFGNDVEGFFTDEPQISRNGIPWSFVMEEEYRARYGENLLEHLDALFFPVEGHKKVRVQFWKMVTELFSSAYMKQIRDWCDSHNMQFTGHLVLEEGLMIQLCSNGACMPHYEYFHVPGMDYLGRKLTSTMVQHQVGSASQQMGQKQVLSETFAMCGHNMSFDEMKGMFEWQMVRGVNLLCQHLEGYSNRGIRKRDYPPAMYVQQPWWSEYKAFVDAMSREGMVLAKGEARPEVLVLHPQTTAWTLYDDQDTTAITELDDKVMDIVRQLEEKHISFHFGDEIMMERHGKVEKDRLVIGCQSYAYVISSHCDTLLPNTESMLKEFAENGGIITTVDALSENPVTDRKDITYTIRYCDGFKAHLFTNTSSERKTAHISVSGKKLDIYSGETVPFCKDYEFEPWGSLLVIDDGSDNTISPEKETIISPTGTFRVAEGTLNTMTLDHCDYYFDGVLEEKNGYVLTACERANLLKRKVQIHQDYFVEMKAVPKTLYLVCEKPENFTITVNGKEIPYIDCGYFRDKSFRKIDIAAYVQEGTNTISFDCDFEQSPTFYENLEKSFIFESEKNKLAYDMEIEAVYLLGDFSVETTGTWEDLPLDASRYEGSFVIDAPKKEVTLTHIEKQGFPFFCGELTLTGSIDVHGENPVLELNRKGVNAVRVEIGGENRVMLTNGKLPLKGWVKEGKQEMKLTLINNLRNLLGPHHLEIGECYSVAPYSFYKEPCVWKHVECPAAKWHDGYCFVEMSI